MKKRIIIKLNESTQDQLDFMSQSIRHYWEPEGEEREEDQEEEQEKYKPHSYRTPKEDERGESYKKIRFSKLPTKRIPTKVIKKPIVFKEEKEFSSIHIDFNNSYYINESFLMMFGTAIKMILSRMFGQDVYLPDISITGSPQQMKSFTNALASEKRYFDSYVRYGLNDPRTYNDKSKLQSSISKFERDTGIKWPFK